MLATLAAPEIGLGASLVPDGVRAPHKTGDVDQSRTECALFYLQSRVVACGLTKENVDKSYAADSEGNTTLARLGKAIVDAWPKRPPRAS